MTDHEYHDRQNLEIFCWPEMMEVFQKLAEIVMISPANISRKLRGEIFTMASIAGGCQHCQSHGGYSLHLLGVDADRIRDIWIFEESDEFSEMEKSALPRRTSRPSVGNWASMRALRMNNVASIRGRRIQIESSINRAR